MILNIFVEGETVFCWMGEKNANKIQTIGIIRRKMEERQQTVFKRWYLILVEREKK